MKPMYFQQYLYNYWHMLNNIYLKDKTLISDANIYKNHIDAYNNLKIFLEVLAMIAEYVNIVD
mgnify:CR=1 FL=1